MQDRLDIRPGRLGAPVGMNRRQALARLGLGASIVYAAPLLLSLGEARASGGSGGGGGEGGGGGSSDGGSSDGAGSGAESSGPSSPSGPSGAAADGTATGSTGATPDTGGVIGDPTADPTIVTDLGTTLP